MRLGRLGMRSRSVTVTVMVLTSAVVFSSPTVSAQNALPTPSDATVSTFAISAVGERTGDDDLEDLDGTLLDMFDQLFG